MKPTRITTLFTLIILLAGSTLSGNAQTIVNITTNTNSSTAYGTGSICPTSNCIIKISSGVTLNINSACSCNTCTFSGGSVTIGANLALSGLDSFKNETVQINQSFSPSTLTFYGDNVTFAAPMNLSGGRTSLDSSQVTVNSALTLAEGTFNKDSLHLNNNLTLSYGVDSFSTSNIDVATGVTITSAQTNVINTTWAFAGSSTMTVNYGLNSSGSNYYLAGTSNINSINATTLSGDNLVLLGTTSNFTSGNALTTTNTNITMNGSGGKVTAQSLTTTGGAITAATGSTISSTNAISLTNTNVNLTGTTFGGSQLTTSGGSFTATNSPVSSTYAISLTNTPTSITGSSFSGSQLTTSGGSFIASGTTVSSTYAVSLTNTPTSFTNSTFTGSALTTSGSTFSLNNTNTTITYADQFTGTAVTMSGTSSLTGSSATFSTAANLAMSGSSAISVTYAYTSTGSHANIDGTATISAGSMSLGSGSYLKFGDGSLASTAHATISGAVSVDNTSTLAVSNNKNYLYSTTSALATNTFSCGGASPQHACVTDYVYGCATITNNIGLACTVLAVAPIDLTASAESPGTVALAWTDNSAPAAGHYEIQRSTGNDSWTTISTVDADAYTTRYQYTDADAPSGSIDYRVERFYDDGNTAYSSICSVNISAAGNTRISIYPNPAVGGRFYLTTPGTEETIVNVFTTTGQILLHTALQGQTQYPIQLPSQPLSLSAIVVQIIYQNNTRSFTLLVN